MKGREVRSLRAGQGRSPEGIIHITLQAMDAGSTEGKRERQQLCPISFFFFWLHHVVCGILVP